MSQYHLKEIKPKKKEGKTLQDSIKPFSKLSLKVAYVYLVCVIKHGSEIKKQLLHSYNQRDIKTKHYRTW